MLLLEYLQRPREQNVWVEFRLLCSGELHPKHFQGNWRKSDGARLLLWSTPDVQMPCDLLVAAQPFDYYPQELALRFGGVVETNARQLYGPAGVHEASVRTLNGDREIASDIAALLTLLTRRLITVAARVREVHSDTSIPVSLRDFPVPTVLSTRPSYWAPRPVTVITSFDGVRYKNNQPAPRPFDTERIFSVLRSLPSLSAADAIVRCARNYALGMELIDNRFQIAYQHLITAIETVAGDAFKTWRPTDAEIVVHYSKLIASAKAAGLSDDAAHQLALAAGRDNPWSRRKFKKFLHEFVADSVFDSDDDLFLVPTEFIPSRETFDKRLNDIYGTRSGASHDGRSFPPTASVGMSDWLPIEAAQDFAPGRIPFPPVGWFERAVNSAINNYIDVCLAEKSVSSPTVSKSTVNPQ